MAKDSIELALSVLEAEKANLSGDQLKRLNELVATGADVRSDVSDAIEATAKRELSPEQTDKLISTFKFRFEVPENGDLRKTIDFADVEKSLRASPEGLFSLSKLEETGGEPQVIGIDGDEFVFEDRSTESPSGRRNLNFNEADDQKETFGSNVRFQSPDAYKAMQKTGEFDMSTWSWLETDSKTRETGGAVDGYRSDDDDYVYVYEGECGARDRSEDGGWRASLRVKKV